MSLNQPAILRLIKIIVIKYSLKMDQSTSMKERERLFKEQSQSWIYIALICCLAISILLYSMFITFLSGFSFFYIFPEGALFVLVYLEYIFVYYQKRWTMVDFDELKTFDRVMLLWWWKEKFLEKLKKFKFIAIILNGFLLLYYFYALVWSGSKGLFGRNELILFSVFVFLYAWFVFHFLMFWWLVKLIDLIAWRRRLKEFREREEINQGNVLFKKNVWNFAYILAN